MYKLIPDNAVFVNVGSFFRVSEAIAILNKEEIYREDFISNFPIQKENRDRFFLANMEYLMKIGGIDSINKHYKLNKNNLLFLDFLKSLREKNQLEIKRAFQRIVINSELYNDLRNKLFIDGQAKSIQKIREFLENNMPLLKRQKKSHYVRSAKFISQMLSNSGLAKYQQRRNRIILTDNINNQEDPNVRILKMISKSFDKNHKQDKVIYKVSISSDNEKYEFEGDKERLIKFVEFLE